MSEAPTNRDLLAGNAADRRRTSRWRSPRTGEWIENLLIDHPEVAVYFLGLVLQVYLASQILPSLLDSDPGHWVSVAIFAPFQLLAGALVHAMAKLTKLNHRLELRRAAEVQQVEDEAQAALVLAERALSDKAAAAQALEAQHGMLECPGPTSKPTKPRYDRQGELIEVTWICITCGLSWTSVGQWRAP